MYFTWWSGRHHYKNCLIGITSLILIVMFLDVYLNDDIRQSNLTSKLACIKGPIITLIIGHNFQSSRDDCTGSRNFNLGPSFRRASYKGHSNKFTKLSLMLAKFLYDVFEILKKFLHTQRRNVLVLILVNFSRPIRKWVGDVAPTETFN